MKGNTTTNFLESISNSKKKVIKKIDLLGRESSQINQPLFYLYDDGTVEKIITIEWFSNYWKFIVIKNINKDTNYSKNKIQNILLYL